MQPINVVLALNSLEPDTWERFEDVKHIGEFLQSKFDEFPKTAKIYHNSICGNSDVTPWDEGSLQDLFKLTGDFYVIEYPSAGLTVFEIFELIVVILSVAASIYLRPKIPNGLSNQQTRSPNNGLSNRSNQVRLGSRIPDIYGEVNSTPDLLSAYTVFENNIEVEYTYMCIGRGSHQVDASSIYDDTTPIAAPLVAPYPNVLYGGGTYPANTASSILLSNIQGSSVSVYAPYTSPNSIIATGTLPQLSVGVSNPDGSPVVANLYTTIKSTGVNGQTLLPPNANKLIGNGNITFMGPGNISFIPSTDPAVTNPKLSDLFPAGDTINLANADYGSPSHGTHLFNISVNTVSHTTGYDQPVRVSLWGIIFTSGVIPTGLGIGSVISLSSTHFDLDDGTDITVGGSYTITSVGDGFVNVLGTHTGSRATSISPQGVNITGYFTQDSSTDLSGLFTVLDSGDYYMDLITTGNANWAALSTTVATAALSPTISEIGTHWVGPFIMVADNINEVWSNFVAENGIYTTDGITQNASNVIVKIGVTPVDIFNNAVGPEQQIKTSLIGSQVAQTIIGETLKVVLNTPSPYVSVRASRETPSNTTFQGTVVDEVKWHSAMAMKSCPDTDPLGGFGDVTTVQAVTQATTGALAVKDRKLNLGVTRMLPTWIGGTSMSTTLSPVNDAANILFNICLDPLIGNRKTSEIDFSGIYNIVSSINNYFGTNVCSQFNYTFDSANVSFEETAALIAHTIFCSAYRRGNLISLTFEGKNSSSSMLFNHRNKIPNSETRSVRFGPEKDYDGVEYTWVSPVDNTIKTYYIHNTFGTPVFGSMASVSPYKIQSVGVRDPLQAYFSIWRAWNKIVYQNTTVEFEALQESDLLLLTDRIQVTDSTRVGTQDGEVISQSGLNLTLSQPVTITDGLGLTIFLQYPDETVDSIAVTTTINPYVVALSRAPTQSLVLGTDSTVNTLYIITGNSSTTPSAYLVTERSPQAKMTNKVSCVNYTDNYYKNDVDYINSVVDLNGNITGAKTYITENNKFLITESGSNLITGT